jgi:hypothetical protein
VEGDASSAGTPPAVEIDAPPRALPPAPRQWPTLLAIAVGSLGAAVLSPASALSWVLPWASIVAFFLLSKQQQPRGAEHVRISAAGLRTSSPGVRTFTPWSEIARLLDGGGYLNAVLKDGRSIAIDLASRPDLRAILALAPPDVVYERAVAEPAPQGMKQSHKTLLLWLLLIVMMIAIWRLADE